MIWFLCELKSNLLHFASARMTHFLKFQVFPLPQTTWGWLYKFLSLLVNNLFQVPRRYIHHTRRRNWSTIPPSPFCHIKYTYGAPPHHYLFICKASQRPFKLNDRLSPLCPRHSGTSNMFRITLSNQGATLHNAPDERKALLQFLVGGSVSWYILNFPFCLLIIARKQSFLKLDCRTSWGHLHDLGWSCAIHLWNRVEEKYFLLPEKQRTRDFAVDTYCG